MSQTASPSHTQTRTEQPAQRSASKNRIKPNYRGWAKLGLVGLGGAALAILLVKFFQAIEGESEEYPLDAEVEPENFRVDRTSYKLFFRLKKWMTVYPKCYNDCIRAVDGLLTIENALRSAKSADDVNPTDIVRAEQHFKMALAPLTTVFNKIQTEHYAELKPREMNRLQNDIEQMELFLGAHLQVIFALCNLL